MSTATRAAVALSVDSQGTRIGKTAVLGPMRLQIPAGRWTAIVGPNGAGKSTLLRVLAGLLATQGTVRLGERPMSAWPARQRARQVVWLAQAEAGGDDLSAYDVVLLGRLPHQAWLAPPSAADHAAVAHAMRMAQVTELRARRLGDLSGGERQRVLLARALAVQAPVWLMDEPLAHLDPPHQADWLALVRAQVATGGTVVSVLHELNIALQADELLIIKDGGVWHHGACASSGSHHALQAAFAGRIEVHPVGPRWVALPVASVAGCTMNRAAGGAELGGHAGAHPSLVED